MGECAEVWVRRCGGVGWGGGGVWCVVVWVRGVEVRLCGGVEFGGLF